jgi:hypothetical protein
VHLLNFLIKLQQILLKWNPKTMKTRPQENQGEENPNPPQPPNINIQIDEGLATLRSLVNDLRGTENLVESPWPLHWTSL